MKKLTGNRKFMLFDVATSPAVAIVVLGIPLFLVVLVVAIMVIGVILTYKAKHKETSKRQADTERNKKEDRL